MVCGLLYDMWAVVRYGAVVYYVCFCMVFGLLYDMWYIVWYVGYCMKYGLL